jgi:cell pole-organizing protein PopZ
MSNAAAQQTESMEDILHSIRRIIANEPEATAGGAEEEPLELTDTIEDEPLELTEVIPQPVVAAPTPIPVLKPEPAPEPVVVAAPAPPPPPPAPAPVVASPIQQKIDSLITQNVAEASAHALKNLVDSIPKPKIDSPMMRSGSTLEDLVVESLKPELSQWLNLNLPVLVQGLVEKEIRKLLPRE